MQPGDIFSYTEPGHEHHPGLGVCVRGGLCRWIVRPVWWGGPYRVARDIRDGAVFYENSKDVEVIGKLEEDMNEAEHDPLQQLLEQCNHQYQLLQIAQREREQEAAAGVAQEMTINELD